MKPGAVRAAARDRDAMRVLHVVCSDRFAGVERHVALLAGAQQGRRTAAVIGGDERSMRRDIGRDDVIFRPTGGLLQTIRPPVRSFRKRTSSTST